LGNTSELIVITRERGEGRRRGSEPISFSHVACFSKVRVMGHHLHRNWYICIKLVQLIYCLVRFDNALNRYVYWSGLCGLTVGIISGSARGVGSVRRGEAEMCKRRKLWGLQ